MSVAARSIGRRGSQGALIHNQTRWPGYSDLWTTTTLSIIIDQSTNKINWTPDFTFFIDMNKLLCKDILLEKQMINPNYSQEKIDIYLKNILFPLFDELLKNLKVDKFFKIKEDTTFHEFYDTFFNTLMEFIEKKISK